MVKFLYMYIHVYIQIGLDAGKPVFRVCDQQKQKPACASAQSDQHFCYCYNRLENILATVEISIF